MRTRPTNSDDVIDSRDVIEAIEELQGEIEALTHGDEIASLKAQAERDEADEARLADLRAEAAKADPATLAELQAELDALLKLQDEAEGYCADWRHGEQLIRDSYFETYAEELADDCGMVDRKLAWPYTCIDWERAARELQYDYTSVEFDGVTYWTR